MNPIFKNLLARAQHAKTGKLLEKRKLQNNTYLHVHLDKAAAFGANLLSVRLHKTDILVSTLTEISVRTGGWFSVTTKDRLNEYLQGTGFQIASGKLGWCWCNRSNWTPIAPFTNEDSLVYASDNTFKLHARTVFTPEQEKTLLREQINFFVRRLLYCDLPLVAQTDCWYCKNYGKSGSIAKQAQLPVDFPDNKNPQIDLDSVPDGGSFAKAVLSTQHLIEHMANNVFPLKMVRAAFKYANVPAAVSKLVLNRSEQEELFTEDTTECELRKLAQKALRKYLNYRLGIKPERKK